MPKNINQEIKIEVFAYPPDNRKRDINNLWKALCDSLQYCKMIEDDYLIRESRIVRCEKSNIGGHLKVKITLLD